MESTARDFNDNVDHALADPNLQDSLGKLKVGFSERRRQAAERLPEFEALRDCARDIKNHTLANLDFYLEEFERKVLALGGHVHWAPTAADARRIIAELCQSMGARTVAKSKSMVAEEIALNEHLEELGIAPIETDLGEYIIQLRHEPPSHIIAPAVHLTKDQVADTFLEHHAKLGFTKRLTERNDLVAEARHVLRQKFLDADVGLTGANFLVAETGSSMLVTNEGNADLSNTLPKMHIVLASIEKVIPTLEDAAVLLRVLARSATGQESSAYTTLNTGDPALHPLRRLHEPLSGLWRDRRPRLWLGLSRATGCRADAAADRRRGGRQPAQCVHLLRALRERLPGAYPAAQADASLARA
jgi:L-lactate dehydrogenase complex protein LldF